MNILNILPLAGKLGGLIPWWMKLLFIGAILASIYAWDASRLGRAREEGRIESQPAIKNAGRIEGRKEVNDKWDADIAKRTAAQLLQEQESRQKEADLNATVNKQRSDYAKDLQRRNATALLVADQLREFREALTREPGQAGTDSTTTPRTDDARNAIILECTSAVAEMDADAGRKSAKIAGLQSYVTDVCLR